VRFLPVRNEQVMPRWKPFRTGEDPDPRFTLANERTYLAWIRTATAFVASGVGLEAFGGDILNPTVRAGLAALLLVGGALIAITSFVHWISAERALRAERPLPVPLCATVLVVEVVN
jgi:putative membrane protein